MREMKTVPIQCCKMRTWSILLLCLSAYADTLTKEFVSLTTMNTLIWRESGESVTMECTLTNSSSSTSSIIGMYLYHNVKGLQEEVLYYHSERSENLSPRERYSKRVEKIGSLKNHTITISNLTVDDSGAYTCVYKEGVDSEVKGNFYILYVSGVAQCSNSVNEPQAHNSEKSPHLVLIIVVTCAISIMVTVVFILLIIPEVRIWTSRIRGTARNVQHPTDCVYEVMTRNRLYSLAAPESLSP